MSTSLSETTHTSDLSYSTIPLTKPKITTDLKMAISRPTLDSEDVQTDILLSSIPNFKWRNLPPVEPKDPEASADVENFLLDFKTITSEPTARKPTANLNSLTTKFTEAEEPTNDEILPLLYFDPMSSEGAASTLRPISDSRISKLITTTTATNSNLTLTESKLEENADTEILSLSFDSGTSEAAASASSNLNATLNQKSSIPKPLATITPCNPKTTQSPTKQSPKTQKAFAQQETLLTRLLTQQLQNFRDGQIDVGSEEWEIQVRSWSATDWKRESRYGIFDASVLRRTLQSVQRQREAGVEWCLRKFVEEDSGDELDQGRSIAEDGCVF